MYEMIVRTEFASAHRLREYRGNCENLHGHSWRVEVRLRSGKLDALGMVIDFREVKKRIRDVVGRLDHTYLNEVPPFDQINPTTENIARHLYEEIRRTLSDPVRIASVTTWESPDCGVTYRED